jgi:hypothetical protein
MISIKPKKLRMAARRNGAQPVAHYRYDAQHDEVSHTLLGEELKLRLPAKLIFMFQYLYQNRCSYTTNDISTLQDCDLQACSNSSIATSVMYCKIPKHDDSVMLF